jgi:hypothetical protein
MIPGLLLAIFDIGMSRKGMKVLVVCFMCPPLREAFNVDNAVSMQRGSLENLETGRMKGHGVDFSVLDSPDAVVSMRAVAVMTSRKDLGIVHVPARHGVIQTAEEEVSRSFKLFIVRLRFPVL